jgi:hypothetical protein
MRAISFSLTEQQFLDGSKDITRRLGWKFLKAGDRLIAARKCMGLGKGGKRHDFGVIEVTRVWRESLNIMILAPRKGQDECRREGFPNLTPDEFVAFFCKSHSKCTPQTIVTRIEFKRI